MTGDSQSGESTESCDYCESSHLAYRLESDKGPVVRCIPCLAVEQAQQQLRMPFDKFVDFDPGVVRDSEEEVRQTRRRNYESTRAWLSILARLRQDDPPLKRDPGAIDAVHEDIRQFILNIMGDDAHEPPSKLREVSA